MATLLHEVTSAQTPSSWSSKAKAKFCEVVKMDASDKGVEVILSQKGHTEESGIKCRSLLTELTKGGGFVNFSGHW